MRMKRWFGVFFMLCYVTIPQAATSSTPGGASASDVVREYCHLDFEGTRLSSNNPDAAKYDGLVVWPNEPGWDGAVVVKDFAITRFWFERSQSFVTVQYFVLGNMADTEVTATRQHKELVTFVLTRSGDTWKIAHPLIPPHISVHASITALDSLLKNEKDPDRMKRLRAGIAALMHFGP
jgi:hypothetical protein